jgi:hypothetical protein
MGSISHSFDVKKGVIRIVGEGVYTLQQATEHFSDLARTVASVRSRHGRVRMLIDTSQGAVQPADVAEKIASATKALYLPEDRVALIAASTLHKFQMRRVTDPGITNVFVSESAALAWLCGHDQ